jgi:hypothetical protein
MTEEEKKKRTHQFNLPSLEVVSAHGCCQKLCKIVVHGPHKLKGATINNLLKPIKHYHTFIFYINDYK